MYINFVIFAGVCIIDDDRLVDISDLEFGFSVWQVCNMQDTSSACHEHLGTFKTFRQRIIGYEERTYTHQPDGSYFYGVYPGTHPYPGYAIMGTGTAILHKAYLEMYFDPEVLPRGILYYVDRIRNCEDLSMNVMVTKFLEDISWQQPAALAVKPIGQIHNLEGEACNHLSNPWDGLFPSLALSPHCKVAMCAIWVLFTPYACTREKQ